MRLLIIAADTNAVDPLPPALWLGGRAGAAHYTNRLALFVANGREKKNRLTPFPVASLRGRPPVEPRENVRRIAKEKASRLTSLPHRAPARAAVPKRDVRGRRSTE